MAFYPTSTSGLANTGLPAGPGVGGPTTTGNASANTKGSYTQIVASTTFTSNSAVVSAMFGTNAIDGLAQLMDLATGAGGAETVVIPNLATDMARTGTGTAWACNFAAVLPWAVASGTRIAARVQGNSGSRTISPNVQLVAAGSYTGISTFVDYGTNTADSGATQVDPGGTSNTKGAYSELTASSSAVTQSLLVMVTWQGKTTAPATFANWAIDIATGSGGAEVVLMSDLRAAEIPCVSDTAAFNGRMQDFLTYIPAATRIAARASCNTNDAANRLIDVGLIAGTAP